MRLTRGAVRVGAGELVDGDAVLPPAVLGMVGVAYGAAFGVCDDACGAIQEVVAPWTNAKVRMELN